MTQVKKRVVGVKIEEEGLQKDLMVAENTSMRHVEA